MRTILQADNLTKIYRVGKVDVPALRGVSLEVHEGEFVAIMGPSGCGKSTMLHLLGGLLTPTTGRIVVDGEDLTAASDAKRTDIRRRKIGFVFQRFNLFPTLTAEGNLLLAERIHANGTDDPERRREVRVDPYIYLSDAKKLVRNRRTSHSSEASKHGRSYPAASARCDWE